MSDMFYKASSFSQYLCWELDDDVKDTNMFDDTKGASIDCPEGMSHP